MLSVTEGLDVFEVNEAVATFATPRVVATPCAGMARFTGSVGYAGGAPASAPQIEFSENGIDWDSSQLAPVDGNAAAGITLYSWDIQVRSWNFVRLTVQPPIGTARGSATLLPTVQN